MEATDKFTITGRTNLRLDAPLSGIPLTRNPEDAYENGVLTLVSPGTPLLGETVKIEIPMTRAEFDLFLANKNSYLSGGTFTFPGMLMLCFTGGTLIQTDRGNIPVECLKAGDLVLTKDRGLQPIRWIGSKKVKGTVLDLHENIRPIRIRAGALGANIPETDLLVSPQHRILIRSAIAQRIFNSNEVLIAAKHLLHLEGIDIASDLTEVEYFHILFDQHEIVLSNGAETESLYVGTEVLRSVGQAALEEIFTIFTELENFEGDPVPARALASGRMGRRLIVRHLRHGKQLVQEAIG